MDEAQIQRALRRIAHELIETTAKDEPMYLIAIPNGGVPLARQLAENLKEFSDVTVPVGILDTTLYRDDLLKARSGSRPSLKGTEMPQRVDDCAAILVDDVISTGRTIRAALDALMDFGRPKSVRVAALVDRGHREFPIKIDFVGKNMPTGDEDSVELRGASDEATGPLEVVVVSSAAGNENESEVTS
ncbi:MAG: bifunctional pyr operon transcriptional regulator/uracil phosphoribosyltransferase PyrR [Deltaproteobacteria bacterium]|nr:bifunctional pyr operon transcriptional regulator/uracil phosphoribosyltransferase PyrR [Deltaproteobacteria bacterium]